MSLQLDAFLRPLSRPPPNEMDIVQVTSETSPLKRNLRLVLIDAIVKKVREYLNLVVDEI